jgi:predicted RNase H-like HicB family nuclease
MVGKIQEIPGVFSQGETLDELKENIRDAYQLMMEDDSSETRADQREMVAAL